MGNFRNDYDVCRNCIHYNEWGSKSVKGKTKHTNHGGPDCLNCDKFEGLTRRLFKDDGFIVKIFSKRVSVFNTCMYELSHAGFEANTKHVHIVTWIGNCSPRRFKGDYEPKHMVCPESECQTRLVPLYYSGTKYKIVKSRSSPDYQRNNWLPLVEDGKVAWSEAGIAGGK